MQVKPCQKYNLRNLLFIVWAAASNFGHTLECYIQTEVSLQSFAGGFQMLHPIQQRGERVSLGK